MRWLINLLKDMKAKKVQREVEMLESGEYDRKIKQEEILAEARAKRNKLRQIREQHRPVSELSSNEPSGQKKKKLTIGI